MPNSTCIEYSIKEIKKEDNPVIAKHGSDFFLWLGIVKMDQFMASKIANMVDISFVESRCFYIHQGRPDFFYVICIM